MNADVYEFVTRGGHRHVAWMDGGLCVHATLPGAIGMTARQLHVAIALDGGEVIKKGEQDDATLQG